jgi:hypothetical protein
MKFLSVKPKLLERITRTRKLSLQQNSLLLRSNQRSTTYVATPSSPKIHQRTTRDNSATTCPARLCLSDCFNMLCNQILERNLIGDRTCVYKTKET